MKRFAGFLTIALVLLSVTGFGEMIIMKSGKSVQGVVTYEDENYIAVKLPTGEIQIPRRSIQEILTDNQGKDWSENREKQERAEPTPVQGTALKILDKDRPIIREKTLADVASEDRRFPLNKFIEPPTEDNNAAQILYTVLDTKNFKMGRLRNPGKKGSSQWNFEDEIFSQLREAAQYKRCNFYPDYLPYPAGIWPPKARFNRFGRVAEGMIALGKEHIQNEDFEEGRRCYEAVFMLGIHLSDSALARNQLAMGVNLQAMAGKQLANYYMNRGNQEKYMLFLEYIREQQYQWQMMLLSWQELAHDFNSGQFRKLMDFALSEEHEILRGDAMDYLSLIKLAGEQLPLRRDVREVIPRQSQMTFNSIKPGDSEEIKQFLQMMQASEKSAFLRIHAGELLSMNPRQLRSVIETLLAP